MGDIEYNTNNYQTQLDALGERKNLHSARLDLLRQELDYVKIENDLLLDHLNRQDKERAGAGAFDQSRDYGGQQRFEHDKVGYRGQGRTGFDYTELQHQQQRDETDRTSQRGGQSRHGDQCRNGMEQRRADEYANARPDNFVHDDIRRRGESRSSEASSVDEVYRKQEMERRRRQAIYSIRDSTAINPQNWEPLVGKKSKPPIDPKDYPHPGGFLFMRFDDSGFQIASDALKRMQSICRYSGGYLLGAARKQRIFVFEVAPSRQRNWFESKRQPHRDFLMTENAVAVFWFQNGGAAGDFLNTTHSNRFREPNFPTPSGYEAFFVPLMVTPPVRPYNCFLFIELLDAHQYSTADMSSFEKEVRNDMGVHFPGCLSMVVSSLKGKEVIKPGSFISPHSKLYVSRFQTQTDVDRLWSMGMIQGLRNKHNLTGPFNVFSFVIDS